MHNMEKNVVFVSLHDSDDDHSFHIDMQDLQNLALPICS